MPEECVLSLSDLPQGSKRCVKAGETEILLIHSEQGLVAVQAECPHAGARLVEGAVCNGRLVCPWHMATFELPTGQLLEPPAMISLKTYPVRIDADQILVDFKPLPRGVEPASASGKTPVFLLIGAGAAGSMAVSTFGERGFAGKIIVVDPAKDEPVDRTQLSKDALGGKISLDQIRLDINYEIERRYASVTKLSSADQSVRLSDGSMIQFDRALIATGAVPKRLEIPGAELAYTIRHSIDVQNILKAAAVASEVVIVGTSFIALEAASALVQTGLHVTVTGIETAPFSKILGKEAAEALMALHERHGTRFRLGVDVRRITREGVTVSKDGKEEVLAAQVIILGVGVEPALAFDHDLPLAPDSDGIAVDASMSAANNIWAAGDIANLNGTRIEHWRVAQQHGRIAALSMLGEHAEFKGVPFFWTYHFGKRLVYLGASKNWDEVVVDGDLTQMAFLLFYLRGRGPNAKVEAVLGCGRDSEMAKLSEPMRNPLTLDEACRAIA
jgi:NADPH-dependent 2,4-dienoyl-CoA reductase/sulfur reductase-like enzyme/nitrite reductase/ring-hydroxylating ferredoxin subunit